MAEEIMGSGALPVAGTARLQGESEGVALTRVELVGAVAILFLAINAVAFVVTIAKGTEGLRDMTAIVVVGLGLLAIPMLAYTIVSWHRYRVHTARDAAELEHRRAQERAAEVERSWVRTSVEDVLHGDAGMDMHYQPIIDLRSGTVVGHEALARFALGTPEQWFDAANEVGLGTELEIAAVKRALSALDRLTGYISINASPATLLAEEFWAVMRRVQGDRVIVELTEHVRVEEYERYESVMVKLRRQGVRLAIDDAGAGHSSMRHIIHMAPEIIKLDRSLTSTVDIDPVRRSLVTALVTFAEAIDATVVAEGIERREEADAVSGMGVNFGQGWLFGRAMPLV